MSEGTSSTGVRCFGGLLPRYRSSFHLFSRCTTSAGVMPTAGLGRVKSEARLRRRLIVALCGGDAALSVERRNRACAIVLVERLELRPEALVDLLSPDLERCGEELALHGERVGEDGELLDALVCREVRVHRVDALLD